MNYKKVDEYIAGQPAKQAKALRQIRRIVLDAASTAGETIAYGMPAYKLNGKSLVYFAGFKHHIGLYPLPSGMKLFQEELSKYKQGKRSV